MTYYEQNKDKWIGYALNSPRTPEQRLLSSVKNRAKVKGWEFNLELSDIVIPEFCPISGLKLIKGVGRPTDSSPSLDRIDNSKGYVKDNVKVISQRINRRKSDLSLEEIRKLGEYIR